MGRDYWVYDTGKIVNILLQADGHPLVHVENPALVHIGGVSHYLAPPSSVGDGRPRWGEAPEWGEQEGQQVRYAIARFTATVLTELQAGRAIPEVPADAPSGTRAKMALVRDTMVELVERHGRVGDGAGRP